jgi:hypothetical protein
MRRLLIWRPGRLRGVSCSQPEGTSEEERASNDHGCWGLPEHLVAAWNTHDADRILALFTATPVYEDVTLVDTCSAAALTRFRVTRIARVRL